LPLFISLMSNGPDNKKRNPNKNPRRCSSSFEDLLLTKSQTQLGALIL
jgi:hypothetical protein